jgi:GDP-4-dehydro-6-deoxy-D-mannose reductase
VRAVRALVTGARGFVGRWLIDHLHHCGDEVVGIDREVEITDPAGVAEAVAASRPEAVYHLAAFSHVGRSWDDRLDVVRVNVLGTGAVLDACRRAEVPPKVLLVSSAEVYGVVAEDRQPISEGEPLAPVTPYAASKAAAEQLAVQAWLGDGLPVVRARPFNHIGPGQADSFVVAALAARIARAERAGDRTVRVGNLAAQRDMTDVRDVVRAYRLLLEHGEPGAAYNVCRGTAVSIELLARRLIELAEADLELDVDDSLVRSTDVPVVCGDASALRQATGWEPELSLDDTLRAVLAEWRRRVADEAATHDGAVPARER